MSHSLRRVIVLAFCLMLLAVPLVANAATTVTVQPPTMNGWGFGWDKSGHDGFGGFAVGPAPAPLGVGAARLSIGADFNNTKPMFGSATHNGLRLADITALSYASYVHPASGDPVAPTLALNVDYDLTDANTGWQGRLVFEPYWNGTVTKGVWQTWDAKAGKWWASGAPGNSQCFDGSPCTFAQILATWPNAGIHATLGAILFQAGSGSANWANFTGYVDALTVNDTVYNFEPASTVYVDDNWTSAALWTDPDGAGPATSMGLDAFAKIQDGIDAVPANGTVNVFPGVYSETAANRAIYDGNVYTFGLFFDNDKPGVTVQGVKADGSPITSYNDVATTITTNATNNFGPSGVWVEGDNVVISGLGLGKNLPDGSDNKTVEIIGENVTLKNNVVDVPNASGALYFGDWRYDAVNNVSYITKYTVEGNWLKQGGSVNISSGAGYTGSAADRKIVNNKFTADAATPLGALVSFNGIVPSVGWYVYPTSGATISGNNFSGAAQYIRSRGTVNEGSFDWAAYWNNNTFDKAAMATTDGNPAHPRAYDYTSGSYFINNAKRIGGVIQAQVDVAQAGDTVLAKAGTYAEQVTLNKGITLKGAGSGAAGTVLTTPSGMDGAMGVVQLTGSGTSAQPLTLKDLRITPNQVAGISVGKFVQSTGVNVDYVTLDNVNVIGTNVYPCSEQERGLFVDLTSSLKHLVVTNSAFNNLAYGWLFNKAVSADTSNVQFVTVSDTTFNHNNHKGIYAEKLADATFTNVTVADTAYDPSLSSGCSYFVPNFAGIDINLKAGTYANLAFNNLTATNNAPGSANGANLTVKARGTGSDSSYATFPATVSNVTVTGGAYTGSKSGIRLGEPGKSNVGPTGVDIKQANLSGNGAYGVDNQTTTQVKAENNWWGTQCPAGVVNGNVDYDPWWTSPTGSGTSTSTNLTVPAGATTAEQNAILACATAGATITYAGNPAAGGVVVNTNGVTIKLNGATVGAGSPAFTINADDVTIVGPGTLNGSNADPAILVKTGADNFILSGVEIKNWTDGVLLEGSHASLKLVNNWLHDNTTGFHFNSATALSGVVTINGNLFKLNSAQGILNDSAAMIPAEYNSWGSNAGAASGDGVSANVDTEPFTFVEVFTDMDPDTLATVRNVAENDVFTVKVKADARGMYAVQYKLTYDPTLLVLQSIAAGPFKGTGACTQDTATAGVVKVTCTRYSPDADVDAAAETVTILTFKADPDATHDGQPSWTTHLDIKTDTDLYGGARDGVKVWVNNGGFGADSGLPGRTITDAQDGQVYIAGLAQFTGYIDLQGRTNDSGALLNVYNQATISGATLKANATSASSGAYTTAYASGQQLVIGNTYYFQIDRALYLPTTATTAITGPAPTSWADFKLLDTRPLKGLGTVILLGGDANDDNKIEVDDATCIGNNYGSLTPSACGIVGSSDVTGDGKVDILDLTLMGGNYNKVASPWTE